MINYVINNPFAVAVIVTILMWADWLLTLAQEKEFKKHYCKHYQSYPVNTIEGNPILRKDVENNKIFNPKHFTVSIIVGVLVFFTMQYLPVESKEIFTGVIWGLFLLVITQHLSNWFGYRASRKGIHGKLYLHMKTGFLVQTGRYFSMTILFLLLSVITGSEFIYGVTIAGLISSIRQIIWMRKIEPIGLDDKVPEKET